MIRAKIEASQPPRPDLRAMLMARTGRREYRMPRMISDQNFSGQSFVESTPRQDVGC